MQLVILVRSQRLGEFLALVNLIIRVSKYDELVKSGLRQV